MKSPRPWAGWTCLELKEGGTKWGKRCSGSLKLLGTSASLPVVSVSQVLPLGQASVFPFSPILFCTRLLSSIDVWGNVWKEDPARVLLEPGAYQSNSSTNRRHQDSAPGRACKESRITRALPAPRGSQSREGTVQCGVGRARVQARCCGSTDGITYVRVKYCRSAGTQTSGMQQI